MATWLALLKARWALTKTMMLATALERGRTSSRAAQARGLVSIMIVQREGSSSVLKPPL